MHELLSIGMVLLLGILGGKLSHRIKIPRVTGYMLTGLIIGPSLFGLISTETLESIHMVNDIALGLILFAIGGEIELSHLKGMGTRVLYIAFAESFGAFALVFLAAFSITGDIGLGVLLGSIGIATAPGVTLMVVREYGARGRFTEMLLAVIAINNILCLVVFRLFFTTYSYMAGQPLLPLLLSLFKELILSVLIGGGIAGIIALWEQKIDDLSELLLVIIGGLLIGIGISKTIGISYLMVSLIIGAVTNNLSMMHRLVYAELRQTEMPFYIAFFVLSGASLHLDSLGHLGLLGAGYLVMRPLGKMLGSYLAAGRFEAGEIVKNNLGIGLFPQAGVAIGLAIAIRETHPELGQIINTVILSSVIVYEALGPFLTKLAIGRAKEIHLQE
jgi:Kef-type K+ transport system membrane component KefB